MALARSCRDLAKPMGWTPIVRLTPMSVTEWERLLIGRVGPPERSGVHGRQRNEAGQNDNWRIRNRQGVCRGQTDFSCGWS